MKNLFAVLSFALLVAACSSTRGNLLSRIEYHDNEVFEREEYHYSDGELALVTRVIYYNNAPDSSWTEYEIRRNGLTTDTIETINSSSRRIKSSDGSVRSYRLVGDKWKEISSRKIDDKGLELEWHSDNSHIWYTYDSQGRSTGFTNIVMGDDSTTQKSGLKIEYSGDGLKSVMTSYDVIETDSLIISSKSVCRYDKKGRILNREAYDPDETDDNHPTFITDTYKYIGKNKVIRIESKKEYRDGNYHNEPIRKYKEKYKNGLRTKIVAYMMKDGKFRKQSVNTWKYDFRAKVPLKSFAYSPSDYIIFRRPWQKTIWTYEK
jgi:hypothetical protein